MTRLLKLREVRQILNVHANTLTVYMRNGKLPFVVMPGGGKRVDEDDLRAFVAERKFGSHDQHP